MGCVFNVEAPKKIIYAGRSMSYNPVYHSEKPLEAHILTYVVEGELNLEINEKNICIKRDGIVFQPSGVQYKSTAHTQASTIHVHFAPDIGDKFFDSAPEDLCSPFVYVNTVNDASNNPRIKMDFVELAESYGSGDKVRQSAYLNIILNDLSKNHLYEDSAYALGMKIRAIINKPVPLTHTNEEIAQKLNVSIRTAETTFKKCFGISIHQYLIQRRVELCKFWLKYYPEQKNSVTAQGLGFFDEYHMSRQFKKITGMSPSEYKREYHSSK